MELRVIKGTAHLKKLEDRIVKWLKEYAEDAEKYCFVVGVSGGIDSATVLALCARTGIRTFAVTMPINQNGDETERALEYISHLQNKGHYNIQLKNIDLESTFLEFRHAVKDYGFHDTHNNKLSLANSKARLRMTTLYMIAGAENGLVVGTGNKVEDFGVGFFTKWGDGAVDLSPIGDLMKSEVYDLGRHLGVSDRILGATPTDGLWNDERTDEDQLGATYDELEWAMLNGECEREEWGEREEEVYEIFEDFQIRNEHKMKPIPVFKK